MRVTDLALRTLLAFLCFQKAGGAPGKSIDFHGVVPIFRDCNGVALQSAGLLWEERFGFWTAPTATGMNTESRSIRTVKL